MNRLGNNINYLEVINLDFGSALVRLRRKHRLSQLELSNLSGVSQKHISFLESGRSKPGPASVSKIVKVLELTFAEVNELHGFAGLVAPKKQMDFNDPEFESARKAMDLLLASHMPNPGLATLRNGDIIASNESFEAALDWCFGGEKPWISENDGTENLYNLTLHPAGLRQFMKNPDEIIPHTLRRLGHAANVNRGAKEILDRCETSFGLAVAEQNTEPPSTELSSVLIERYEIKGNPLNLVSMVACFGSPEDVTAQSLQLELFFPADAQTESTIGLWTEPIK